MKRINIVYDNDYNDVDILLIPDEIAVNIDRVVWDFNCWLRVPENCERFLITNADGQSVLGIDTNEFLWWLNNVRITGEEVAVVEKQHTLFVQEYPVAEF